MNIHLLQTLPKSSFDDNQNLFYIADFIHPVESSSFMYLTGMWMNSNVPVAIRWHTLPVSIYVLPRSTHQNDPNRVVTSTDVKEEIQSLVPHTSLSTTSWEWVEREYHFDRILDRSDLSLLHPHYGVPAKTFYWKISFCSTASPWPHHLKKGASGNTFSHLFGYSWSVSEQNALQTRLVSPGWIHVPRKRQLSPTLWLVEDVRSLVRVEDYSLRNTFNASSLTSNEAVWCKRLEPPALRICVVRLFRNSKMILGAEGVIKEWRCLTLNPVYVTKELAEAECKDIDSFLFRSSPSLSTTCHFKPSTSLWYQQMVEIIEHYNVQCIICPGLVQHAPLLQNLLTPGQWWLPRHLLEVEEIASHRLGLTPSTPMGRMTLDPLVVSTIWFIEPCLSTDSPATVWKWCMDHHILDKTRYLAQLCQCTWNSALRGLSSVTMESLFLNEMSRRQWIPTERVARLSYAEYQQQIMDGTNSNYTYEGGINLEPKRGHYTSCVATIDITSTYPSIVQEFNICYSTYPHWLKNSEEKKEYIHRYSPTTQPTGLLAEIMNMMVSLRKQTSFSKNMSMVIKTAANTIYGLTAMKTFRFYAPFLADKIAEKGRDVFRQLVEVVEKDVGADSVLYGVTDSVMPLCGTQDRKKAAENVQVWMDHFNRMYSTIQVKLEVVYDQFMLFTKNKLVGWVNGEMVVKGMDFMSSNSCAFIQKAVEQLLLFLFTQSQVKQPSIQEIYEHVRTLLSNLSDLSSEDVPVSDLVIHQKINQYNFRETIAPLSSLLSGGGDSTSTSSRSNLSLQSSPQYWVALEMERVQQGVHFMSKESVPYVWCVYADGEKRMSVPVHPDWLRGNTSIIPEYVTRCKVDMSWYIQKRTVPMMTRILDLFDDFDETSFHQTVWKTSPASSSSSSSPFSSSSSSSSVRKSKAAHPKTNMACETSPSVSFFPNGLNDVLNEINCFHRPHFGVVNSESKLIQRLVDAFNSKDSDVFYSILFHAKQTMKTEEWVQCKWNLDKQTKGEVQSWLSMTVPCKK